MVRNSDVSGHLTLVAWLSAGLFIAAAIVPPPAFAVVLYGTDTTGGVLYRIDGNGNANAFVTSLYNPSAVAVGPDGSVYVRTTTTSDVASDFTILKVSPAAITSTILSGLPNATRLTYGRASGGLAVDSHGNLFVSNPVPNFPELIITPPAPPGELPYGVLEVTQDGTVLSLPSSPSEPLGLAIDRQDNLYVGSFFPGPIIQVTPNGAKSTFSNLGGLYLSLATDSLGDVFFMDPILKGLCELSPQGQLIHVISRVNQSSIAIDRQDNLYVPFTVVSASGLSQGISKITSDGQTSMFSNAAVGHIATMVPEPSAWILFAIGAAVAAFVAYRDRRRQLRNGL